MVKRPRVQYSCILTESYQVNTRFTRLNIRVIDKCAVYAVYTTVIGHTLQENLLHAVLYRLPVNMTVPHTLLWLTHIQ